MPSLRSRENIEFGPREIVRFWHSRIIRILKDKVVSTASRWTSCEEETYGAGIAMIDGECKPRQNRYHYTTLPRRPIPVSPYDAVNNGITDIIFNFDIVDNGPIEVDRKGRSHSEYLVPLRYMF